MSFLGLLPQTATINTISDNTLDEDRNWTRTSSSTEVACRLQLLGSTEPDARGVGLEDRWRLFLPAGTIIGPADEVIIETRRFQVAGSPDRVYGAQTEHHVEVTLLYVADVEQTFNEAHPSATTFPATSLYPIGA